jgi:Tfp pilus assembly protein PilF
VNSSLTPRPRHAPARLLILLVPLWLGACAWVRPPVPASVSEVMARPAERQLLAGLRLYDDAQYREAEMALGDALRLQLASPRDQASAWKTLAFVYCTSARKVDCEQAFRNARAADPSFALSKAESGHPVWGPVYQASRR